MRKTLSRGKVCRVRSAITANYLSSSSSTSKSNPMRTVCLVPSAIPAKNWSSSVLSRHIITKIWKKIENQPHSRKLINLMNKWIQAVCYDGKLRRLRLRKFRWSLSIWREIMVWPRVLIAIGKLWLQACFRQLALVTVISARLYTLVKQQSPKFFP